jgi:hypothetical protein
MANVSGPRAGAEGAEAVCWFCEKNAPADGSAHTIVLCRTSAGVRTERTLQVPRCRSCEEVHQRIDKGASRVAAVGGQLVFWPLLGLCVLFGLTGGLPGAGLSVRWLPQLPSWTYSSLSFCWTGAAA